MSAVPKPDLVLVPRDFWQRAFLAALPACMQVSGWQWQGQRISTAEQRVALAARTADDAIEEARARGLLL